MDIRRTRVVTFLLAAAVQCAALLISVPQARPQPDELIETVVIEMSASEAIRLAQADPGFGNAIGSPVSVDGAALIRNGQRPQTRTVLQEPFVEPVPGATPNAPESAETKTPLQAVENPILSPALSEVNGSAGDTSGETLPAAPQGPSVAGQPGAGNPEEKGPASGVAPSGGTGDNPGPGGGTGPTGKGTPPGPDWKDVYAARVILHIEQFKRYPNWAIERRVSGTVTLQLCLSRDGALKSVAVVGSSGSKGLDAEAVQTAKAARPYPAFPDEAVQDQICVIIHLTYQIKTK